MALIEVDLNDLPESDTIPKGQYPLMITNVSDPRPDKNGADFVSLEFTIRDDHEYAGRKIFEPYVPLAGDSRLRKIAKAASHDKTVIKDTSDMIGWELDAVVGVRDDDRYGAQNRVEVYLAPAQVVAAPKGKVRR